MNKVAWTFCCMVLALGVAVAGAEPAAGEALDSGKLRQLNLSLLQKLSKSLVEVEYFFRPDENGERKEHSVGYLCPNCNSMHYRSADALIEAQRPLHTPGYAVAPDSFIASDVSTMPDWLETLEVVFEGKRYPAKIAAYYPGRRAVLLKTETAIPGVEPLRFKADAPGRKFSFFRVREDGMERASVQAWSDTGVMRFLAAGKDCVKMPPNTLIVNSQGDVVALSMTQTLPVGSDLLAAPETWVRVSAAEREAELARVETELRNNLYPVQIRLRPVQNLNKFAQRYSGRDEENRNEVNGYALHLSDGRLLVAAALTPAETARLQRIAVTVNGKEVETQFVGSARHFGILVARAAGELPGKGVALYSGNPAAVADEQLILARVKSFGRKLKLSVYPKFADSFEEGFRGVAVPDLNGDDILGFTADGKLLAMPLVRRSLERNYDGAQIVAAPVVAKLLKEFDPNNVPQQGEEKIAYLGIEFQTFDAELARAKKVAEITDDGENGLLITHVYPDSPAAKLGLKSGDILLSVLPASGGKPEQFKRYNFMMDRMENFPWERYDQIPQQYYSEIPAPWGTTRNNLNALLGKIGIGSKAKLTVYADGKLETREFTISAAPESFDTTERWNDVRLGLTVTGITYEVRNYFQLKDKDTGVLIAAVKPGSPAAVAGIKPYEMIISVNGKPVTGIADFKELTSGDAALRLGVRRLTATRIVTLTAENKK